MTALQKLFGQISLTLIILAGFIIYRTVNWASHLEIIENYDKLR